MRDQLRGLSAWNSTRPGVCAGRGQLTSGGKFQQEGNEKEQLKPREGRWPPPSPQGSLPLRRNSSSQERGDGPHSLLPRPANL